VSQSTVDPVLSGVVVDGGLIDAWVGLSSFVDHGDAAFVPTPVSQRADRFIVTVGDPHPYVPCWPALPEWVPLTGTSGAPGRGKTLSVMGRLLASILPDRRYIGGVTLSSF
jgi:hypothetical protein